MGGMRLVPGRYGARAAPARLPTTSPPCGQKAQFTTLARIQPCSVICLRGADFLRPPTCCRELRSGARCCCLDGQPPMEVVSLKTILLVTFWPVTLVSSPSRGSSVCWVACRTASATICVRTCGALADAAATGRSIDGCVLVVPHTAATAGCGPCLGAAGVGPAPPGPPTACLPPHGRTVLRRCGGPVAPGDRHQ